MNRRLDSHGGDHRRPWATWRFVALRVLIIGGNLLRSRSRMTMNLISGICGHRQHVETGVAATRRNPAEPPYKSGQGSANDNNANQPYPTLDAAISATYAAKSTAKLKSKLYDSYVRAIRWATDRIGDAGIIAYVTNSGWITGNTTAGLRLAMPEEFSALYIYDLRGNQRQSDWRAEGGKIFDDGSQTGAAILIAVKNPAATGPCQIHYRNIGDGLSRDDKLAIIAKSELPTMAWETISPNDEGDWVDPRDEAFSSYTNRRQTRIRRPGHLHRLLRRTQNQPRCLGVQLLCRAAGRQHVRHHRLL